MLCVVLFYVKGVTALGAVWSVVVGDRTVINTAAVRAGGRGQRALSRYVVLRGDQADHSIIAHWLKKGGSILKRAKNKTIPEPDGVSHWKKAFKFLCAGTAVPHFSRNYLLM